MKRFVPGQKLQFSADAARQDDGEWFLILGPDYVEKYNCQFNVAGGDFSEFVRTGQKLMCFHDMQSFPVGDLEYRVDAAGWWGRAHFASDLNPVAATAEKLWNTKSPVTGKYYLNAVSAGLEVLDAPDVGPGEVLMIEAWSPYEVSLVPFGAYRKAGRGLSMTLDAAVADGTITADDAALLADDDSENTEGIALRTELETLRTENARLTAELAAKGTPAPESTAAVELDNPKPEALTREQILAAVRESRAEAIAATADRIYRRLTGKLPD